MAKKKISAIFPAEQTQLFVLMVKVNRKNTHKKYGRPCQVQPILLTFWDFGSPTMTLVIEEKEFCHLWMMY